MKMESKRREASASFLADTSFLRTIVLLLCCLGILAAPQAHLGIPGTTQTFDGYDTEFGNNAPSLEIEES
jgi:hypothetical protein